MTTMTIDRLNEQLGVCANAYIADASDRIRTLGKDVQGMVAMAIESGCDAQLIQATVLIHMNRIDKTMEKLTA